jgi:regulator of cell morphogenesis and NO signaling
MITMQKKEFSLVGPLSATQAYESWEADKLADHIVENYHRYIRQQARVVNNLVQKVAGQSTDFSPRLSLLANKTFYFIRDLLHEMVREENVVFPAIRQMVRTQRDNSQNKLSDSGSPVKMIRLASREIKLSVQNLRNLRKLTNNFQAPPGNEKIYDTLYDKMKEFESKLIPYFKLKQEVLLPKAVALEAVTVEAFAETSPQHAAPAAAK